MEESILKWLEFGDSIQMLDVYNKKFRANWFKILYNISKNMYFSKYLYYILIIIFFAQIIALNIGRTATENDKILELMKYLEKVLLFEKAINNDKTHTIVLIASMCFFAFSLLIEFLSIILLFAGKSINIISKLFSFLVLLYMYYLFAKC